jgi:predicted AAA+ superfamily ATPase
MTSDNLKSVLVQSASRPLPRALPRRLSVPVQTSKVICLAGLRRSGKTFTFFDTMRRLLASGVDRRRLVYLNLEDDRLQPIRADELDLVLRCHREIFPDCIGQQTYLFLDEPQNVAGWERWVRRLHDTEDVALFVTGSSSRLMTRDLASALRGRSVTVEVFPLSFQEYLDFRGLAWQPGLADSESAVRAAFEDYLRWGGFPEVVLAEDAMKPLILGEYSSLMLYRDIVERYRVRNEPLMRELLRFACRHTASLVNVSKLHRDFSTLGLGVSKNTLFQYLDYLEDSFLVFFAPKHERSLRKQAHNPRKLHVADPGLVAAFEGDPDRDVGRKLETVVFLALRRQGLTLHYQANGGEIDICEGNGRAFWNACWRLAEAPAVAREQESMRFGRTRYPKAEAALLYHEYAPALLPLVPDAQPAWRWLLEQPPVRRTR